MAQASRVRTSRYAARILPPRPDGIDGQQTDRPPGTGGAHVLRRLRAVRRAVSVLLWTLVCAPIQALCLMLPGRPKVMFPRLYWWTVSRLLGLRVRVIGTPATASGNRRVVFVSKDDVARWPVVNVVARLGRTVFVSRQRGATVRERDTMVARLAAGDSLLLFPEGTSSDGSRVLPFRSSFFAIVEGSDPPLIQPVSVVYDRLGGLPTGRSSRPVFAWYGSMELASHYAQFAQHSGLRATILLHAPIDPARFADRKALSHAVWQIVADGAARLRQNRPVEAPGGATAAAEPAYA